MNDAYGDPRNYDPNDPYWDQNNYDPTWGPPPAPQYADPYAAPNPKANMEPMPSTPPAGGGGKTPQQIEAEGREYDRQHGFIGGYMVNGQWVNGSPSSTGGGGGGGGRVASGPYDGGGFPAPVYPDFEHAPAFQFDPYTQSSWGDAENEPGYGASRTNLRKQIEAGAAYRGMLRSGMTIGDLYSNLDALSQQNFTQFDNRRFRNWEGNMGLAKTKHDYVVGDIDRGNNYRFNLADAAARDSLERWKAQVASLTQLSRPVD